MHLSLENLFRVRSKAWRLVVLTVACLATALSVTFAAEPPNRPIFDIKRDFWIWDLRVKPPAFRRSSATLRATGRRSLIYVENKLWGGSLNEEFVQRLQWQLESSAPSGAWKEEKGVIPLQEELFGPLPRKVTLDDRLIVLFADLGQYRTRKFDGFFNAFDQLTDAEARMKYNQRSNESNVVYVNGFRGTEAYTAGVVSRELQHLLADAHSESVREVWLSETLAEAAMLLTGYFSHQPKVNEVAEESGKHPLITLADVHRGPQLLFASFLLDSLSPNGPEAIAAISNSREPGKSAVERVFREQTGSPLNFDAIFSNFVSYVFSQSHHGTPIPGAWNHQKGVVVPSIQPYFTFKSPSGELEGQLAPYSFLAIDLARELSPSIVIQAERIPIKGVSESGRSCSKEATVLWKPISPKRIALYAVGCDPVLPGEKIGFRLKILD